MRLPPLLNEITNFLYSFYGQTANNDEVVAKIILDELPSPTRCNSRDDMVNYVLAQQYREVLDQLFSLLCSKERYLQRQSEQFIEDTPEEEEHNENIRLLNRKIVYLQLIIRYLENNFINQDFLYLFQNYWKC